VEWRNVTWERQSKEREAKEKREWREIGDTLREENNETKAIIIPAWMTLKIMSPSIGRTTDPQICGSKRANGRTD